MKIRLVFGLLWLRRFWVITTSNNTAKPCHCFVSLFYAKHRAARDQWPVQLLYSSFVSPSQWKKSKALISSISPHIFDHFLSSELLSLHPPAYMSFALIFQFLTPLLKLFPPASWCCSEDVFPIVFHHFFFSLENAKKKFLAWEICPLAKLATMPCFPGNWDCTLLPVRRSVFKITLNPSIPSKKKLASPLGLKKMAHMGSRLLKMKTLCWIYNTKRDFFPCYHLKSVPTAQFWGTMSFSLHSSLLLFLFYSSNYSGFQFITPQARHCFSSCQ